MMDEIDMKLLSPNELRNKNNLQAYSEKVRAVPVTIDSDVTLTDIREGLAAVGMALVSGGGGLRIVKVRHLMRQAS